ncbi:DEAD/DEAH box helicase family protein [Gordonia alkaliphila]|uniref:DEAD/DEAH box helicase family protein n=1 Tax=Gordonia alkaliphila TaxID=1053547 RepID=UPI001FF2FE76|nr:DEAD/DEAH box helicase family protein [Gordonia alkaliphila]MCK0439538.1 DEAD/DEAH box helicase family protein [Gordonia alkaliphila]
MTGNFGFLKAEWPRIHESAKSAERDALFDGRTTCFYTRHAVELTVKWVFTAERLSLPRGSRDLNGRLHDPQFQSIVPRRVRSKMDFIRERANRAVHEEGAVPKKDGIELLEELFHILWWLAHEYGSGPDSRPAPQRQFDRSLLPKPGHNPAMAKTVAQLKELTQSVEAKDQQLESAEAERKSLADQVRARDAQLAQTDAARASAELESASKDELIARLQAQIAEAKAAAAATPDTHDYNEAKTRERIIDLMLREAGWDLDQQRDREYPVTGMPGGTGNGFVDYVLWSADGLPLAVIEAKRTSKDASVGKHQAKLYADALEQMTGRRPFIFYTNGDEIFFWDDLRYPPRPVEGFYTRDQLELERQRRTSRRPLADVQVNTSIVERPYQLRAIRRVTQSFDGDKPQRAALLVMATGSGKTRTVIALSDILIRANWATRILVLADRVALVKQAANAFKTFLPDSPPVNLLTDRNTDGRVYVSTYPTMMGLINELDNGRRRFGPGYFDLIVIDEAHRSVYQKYRRIFEYFDSYLLGLTATPKEDVDHNTYQLFHLETGVPTDDYDLDEAISDGWLVPPRAVTIPLTFPSRGIRYDDLTPEEQERWEAQDWGDEEDTEIPGEVAADAVNTWLFNTDTVDKVLEVLMTRGHRVAGGDRLGKTIIFAKNQRHADFIAERFDANYPEYKGHFAAVITHAVSHGDDLIDKFAQADSAPHIAVSVDMLDTGIDVPEVVNLVFFKPVRSKTKFWQMVGRGTRLRPDLYGPGNPKTDFLIFDVCDNFEYFRANPKPAEARRSASLSERLFTCRVELIGALDRRKASPGLRSGVADLLSTQVAGMNLDNFLVRPYRRSVETYSERAAWDSLTELQTAELIERLAGLPTEVRDPDEMAKRFDLIVLREQFALITGDESTAEREAERVRSIAEGLLEQLTIPKIAAQEPLLREVASAEWWTDVTLEMLESARTTLRSLVGLLERKQRVQVYSDFTDTFTGEVGEVDMPISVTGTDRSRFLAKVRSYLLDRPEHLALRKLRSGSPLTDADLASLQQLLDASGLGSNDDFANEVNAAQGLGRFIRSLVGLDRTAVNGLFTEFVSDTNATAEQIDFVGQIVDYLTRNGEMDPGRLYEPPFTDTAPQGPNQVFDLDRLRDLVSRIEEVNRAAG